MNNNTLELLIECINLRVTFLFGYYLHEKKNVHKTNYYYLFFVVSWNENRTLNILCVTDFTS